MTIEMANRLVELRKKNGYSQETLAEQLGVSRQSVSKWERAESSPDLDNLTALSELYGVTVDELIHGSSSSSTTENKEETFHIGFDGIHISTATEKVNISRKGVFVDDGKDKVHIHPGHIYVEEQGNEAINIQNGHVFVKGEERTPGKVAGKIHAVYVFLVLIAFFLWGFLANGWYIAWTLFLTIPVVSSFIDAVVKRNPSHFAYPVLMAFIYLLGGMLVSWWGIAWVLFLTIPIYYAIVNAFRK